MITLLVAILASVLFLAMVFLFFRQWISFCCLDWVAVHQRILSYHTSSKKKRNFQKL